MVTDNQIRKARRLISQGAEPVDVMKATGLGAYELARIASGELKPKNERLQRKKIPPRRCPDCGALIYLWPCVACFPDDVQPELEVCEDESSQESQESLSSSEEARYQEVKHWRRIYGNPAYNTEHPLHRSTIDESSRSQE